MAFSYNTTQREERLLAATPDGLEAERASMERKAESLAVHERAGSLDQGDVILERELLDWRIETWNRTLETRPELALQPIDRSALYAEAAEKAQNRQQAAEESFRSQWDSPSARIVERLGEQEKSIRAEWLSDLQAGRLNRPALDSYFAGRVDQHNALIEMAAASHPLLRETLPAPIQFGSMRDQLQQQVQANRQAQQQPEQSLVEQYQRRQLTIAGLQQKQTETMQAIINRSRERELEQQRFGIAV